MLNHPGHVIRTSNSMLNHPGLVILTSWIFFEIFTSGRYLRDMEILKILAPNSLPCGIYL